MTIDQHFNDETYFDWRIEFRPPPIATRAFDWVATHPQYTGLGDARIVHAETREALIDEILLWEMQNAD